MSVIYVDEIKKTYEILLKEFVIMDTKKDGTVTLYQLKKILNKSNLITPKELNALIRSLKTDPYEYKNLQDDLYQVRYELTKSRLLENSLDYVQKTLVEECKKYDSSGKIDIPTLRDIILNSKFISLTPFQINILIGEAEQDDNKKIDYIKFSFIVKEMSENVFSVRSLSTAAELVKQGTMKEEDIEYSYISNIDLFKIFKRYDLNLNGYLELDEYMECLKDQNLELSKQEVTALSLIADTNGDGKIDYEEFMKHFKDILHHVRFHRKLTTSSSEIFLTQKAEQIAKKKEDKERRLQQE